MSKHHALLLSCCLALAALPACGARSSLDDYENGLPSVVPLTGQGSDAPDAGDGGDGGDGDGDGDGDGSDNGDGDGDGDTDGSEIGAACSDNDACAGDTSECLENVRAFGGFLTIAFPSGYCSQSCRDDDDCPEGTGCFSGLGTSVCLVRCTTASQCRTEDGYTCGQIPIVGDGRDYCQPPFDLGGLGGLAGF